MAAAKKTKSPGRKEHKARIAKMHRKLEKAAIKAANAAVNVKKEKDQKRKADKKNKNEDKISKSDVKKKDGKAEKKEGKKTKADQKSTKAKSVAAKDKKKKKEKKLSVDELLAVAEETGESDAAMSEDDDDEPEETEEPAKNAETRMSVEDFFKGGFKASDSEDEEASDDDDGEEEDEDENLIDDEAVEDDDEEGDEENEPASVEAMDEDDDEEIEDEDDEDDSLDGFVVDDDEEIEQEESSDDDVSQGSDAEVQEKDDDGAAFLSDNEETPFLSDNDQEMNEDEEEEEDGQDEDQADMVLKKETVLEWINQVESKRSVKDMRKLIVGFKSAVTMTDEESKPDGLVYTITDSEVFNLVIVATMRNASVIFSKILPTKKSPAMSSRWAMQKSMVKQYLTYLLQLLKNLTDSDMLYLAIKEAEKCSLYWACFDRMAKLYMKVLLDHWANAALSDHVRIQAFLALRSLSVTHVDTNRLQETHYLELCLKNIYLTFVRNCKDTTVHTLPAINMMRNLAVQLYSINPDISYQQAFVYIRQLAIHLRSAMQLKTKASYQPVYNWQYVHCIDYWSNMLANCCQDKESPLRPLIYPLTQVALGAVKLIPTAQYFPLRFHILKSVATLGKATDVYIPLGPYLFELFENPELLHQAKPSTLKPLDWDVHLRAPKQYLHGRVYQDGVFEQLEAACLDYFKSYYHHIAFPEMAIPAISSIKRFVKKTKCKNPKGIKRMKDLAKKLELKANFVLTSRSKVDFSPADEAKVQEFIEDMRQKLQ